MATIKGTVYNSGGTTTSVNYILEYTWNYSSIENNTSNITLKHYAQATSTSIGAVNLYGTNPSKLAYQGKSGVYTYVVDRTQNMDFRNKKLVELGEWTGDVEHLSDGTLTLDLLGEFSVNGTSSVTGGKVETSWTLPTIARATACPTFSVDVEKSTTITLNPASDTFTHSIKLVFGSLTRWLNASGGLSTSEVKLTSFTPKFTCPTDYYAQFTGASATGTITLYTYSGSTKVGEKENTFTIKANATTCQPSISGSLTDGNDETYNLTQNANSLINGYSTGIVNLSIRPSANADSNATLSSLKINGTSVDVSTTEYPIGKVNSNSVTIEATNSRGATYKATKTITATGSFIQYSKLSLDADYYRPLPTTGDVSTELKGTYFNKSFGSVDNTISLSIYYKEKGASDWTLLSSPTPTTSSTSWSYSADLGDTYDYQKIYQFRTVVKDKLETIDYTTTVAGGIAVFSWSKDDFYIKDVPTYDLVRTVYSYPSDGATKDKWYKIATLDSSGGYKDTSIIIAFWLDGTGNAFNILYAHSYHNSSRQFKILGGEDITDRFKAVLQSDNTIAICYKASANYNALHFKAISIDGATLNGEFIGSSLPSGTQYSFARSYSAVATSGAYSDLSGTPSLATVATSGKYSDLTGKPTIITPTDYITSSGTSGIWRYQKYNSGLMKAYGTTSVTTAISTASGNLYRSGALTQALPSGFTSIISSNITYRASNVIGWVVNRNETTTSTLTYYLVSVSSVASASRTIDFIVVGLWK